jgi:para-aminobenzoate synthetase component 1
MVAARSEQLKDGCGRMGDVRAELVPDLGSLLARCPRGADLVVVRDGASTVLALEPDEVIRAAGHEALTALDELSGGWWAGFLAYDLGRAVERVPALIPPHPAVPDLLLARFDARLVLEPGEAPRIEGGGRARARLESMLNAAPTRVRPPALRAWRTSLDRDAWISAVETVLEHLRAGDCYQVNLTRQLVHDGSPDPVDLFRVLTDAHPAPHEALVHIGSIGVVSASPERFLRRDGRRIETRPIKGTSSDPRWLRDSAKDRAENVMIVDLARNDLGRVCDYGTVHVPAMFDIEEHPGLSHLVSTVAGTLRPNVTPGDVIRATFPPASVTGCPKPRVLEIIETLEPVRRGVYCGAVGFIDADNDVMDLNVAIRTFTIADGRTTFGVGGAIVADSRPGAEWDETELKARRLLQIVAGD